MQNQFAQYGVDVAGRNLLPTLRDVALHHLLDAIGLLQVVLPPELLEDCVSLTDTLALQMAWDWEQKKHGAVV